MDVRESTPIGLDKEIKVLYNIVTFLYKHMTTITEDGGRQNMFAKEPPIQLIQQDKTMNENAELQNGRWAMIGIVAALGTYAVTGQIIPCVF